MKVYTSASNITTVDFLYKLHSTVLLLMAGLSVVNAISILKILLLLHAFVAFGTQSIHGNNKTFGASLRTLKHLVQTNF